MQVSKVEHWTPDEVVKWAIDVVKIPPEDVKVLTDMKIDGSVITKMNYDHCKAIGFSFGAWVKIDFALRPPNTSNGGKNQDEIKINDLIDVVKTEENIPYKIENYSVDVNFVKMSKLSDNSILDIYSRRCYYDMWDTIQNWSKQKAIHNNNYHRFLVKGNPGIGKTYFLFWIMFQLLKRNITVVYRVGTEWYLLNPSLGLYYRTNSTTAMQYLRNPAVYYLVDTISNPGEVDAFTILCASPRKTNYKEFEKYEDVIELIMPVWDRLEINLLYDVKLKSVIDVEKLNEKFNRFGGIPRFLFDNSTKHESKQDASCALADLQKSLLSNDSPDSDPDVSHYIVRMHPEKGYRQYQTYFLTAGVGDKIIERYRKEHREKLLEFVKDSLADDYASLSAYRGVLFENMSHTILIQGGSFDIYGPLGHQDASLSKIHFQKCFVMPVDNHKFNNAKALVYYRPSSPTFPVIDSWIGTVGFFQISTAKRGGPMNRERLVHYMDFSKGQKAVHNKFFLVIPKERFEKEEELRKPIKIKAAAIEKPRKKNKLEPPLEPINDSILSELQQYLLIIDLSKI